MKLMVSFILVLSLSLSLHSASYSLDKHNPFGLQAQQLTRYNPDQLWNPRFTVDLKVGSVMSFVPSRSNIPFENINARGAGLALIGVDAGIVLFENDRFDFGIVGGGFVFSAVSNVLKTGPDSTIYTSRNYQHVGCAANLKLFKIPQKNPSHAAMFNAIKLGFFYGLGNYRMTVPGINRAGSITGNEISFSLVIGK